MRVSQYLKKPIALLLALVMLLPALGILPLRIVAAGTNDTQYPFSVNGNIICSTNQNHNSTSTYTYTVEKAGTFALRYKVSSESGYDYLRIWKDSTNLVSVSGTSADWKSKNVTVSVGDVITVTYSKDGSSSSGYDCGWVDFSAFGNLQNSETVTPPTVTGETDTHVPIARADGSSYVLFVSGRTGSASRYSYSRNYSEGTKTNGGYDLYSSYSDSNMRTITIGRSFTMNCNVNEVAELSVYAYDIDESSGERDRIYLVDETAGTRQALGLLSGMDSSWNNTTFRIDPSVFTMGHRYHFELTHEVSGWVSWVRNVTLTVNGPDDDDTTTGIESVSAIASIDNYGQIVVDVTAKGYNAAAYNLEIKATATATEAQHGQLFTTVSLDTTQTTNRYSLSLESGSPEGTYRIDVYFKNADGSVVKTATTTATTPGIDYAAVAYNPNGGSNNIPIDTTAYASGDRVTVRFDYLPSRAGYTFLGWATSSTATTPTYTASGNKTFTIGSEDVVLYAVWRENVVVTMHTVTFVDYNGDVLYTTEVEDGATAVYGGRTPTRPDDADASFVFAGWDRALSNVHADMTVGAVYTRVPYNTIVAIGYVSLGEVSYGTSASALGLPSTVTATLASGDRMTLSVVWDKTAYNPNRPGSQTISGTVTIPAGYLSSVGTTAIASVTVRPASGAEIIEITGLVNPNGVSVGFHTPFEDLNLPERVVAETTRGSITVSVTWSSAGYASTAYGDCILTGTIRVPYGYTMAPEVSKNVQITVTVTSTVITEIPDINMGLVPENCTYESLGLPGTVAVITSTGAVHYMPVTWTQSDYNPAYLGAQTIRGSVEIADGFVLASGVDTDILATVTTSDAVIGQADIVFLVDTTGSMYDEIQNVKNNIRNFAQQLNDRGIVLRWALIEYRDITCDGNNSTKIHLCGYDNWYIDVNRFKDEIARLQVNGGGDREETIIDALEAAHTLDARTGVSRFYIAVTDADYKLPNNYGVTSMQQEIATLVSKGIITSVVTKRTFFNDYRSLTDGTGGILADIDGNFAAELNKLVDLVYDGVLNLHLTEIRVTTLPNKLAYHSGERFDGAGMVVTAFYEDGTSRVVDGYSVSPAGPLTVGTSAVEINYRGRICTVEITVSASNVPVSGVRLDPSALSLEVGYTHALSATVTPAGASHPGLTFTSSNINVAEVDANGVVYARGVGNAVITVTTDDGGYTATTQVTVTSARISLGGIELDRENVTLDIGETVRVHVMFTPTNATEQTVDWYSDNPDVAFVDVNGRITAVGAGTATISAVSRDGGYTVYCLVTVLEPLKPGEAYLEIGHVAGNAGDTVSVDLILHNAPDLKSIALYDFEYDRSQLELVNAEWKVAATIQDWNAVTQKAIMAYSVNTPSNTVIFTLTFRILDSAETGNYRISCMARAKENIPGTGDVDVALRVVSGEIAVTGKTRGDLDGDGRVTSNDVVYLLWHTYDPAAYPCEDCDFNKDGIVDSNDAVYLLYFIYFPDVYPL